MTLQELYYQTGGSAFHHEITEDIAVDYLSNEFAMIIEEKERLEDIENNNSTLEDEVGELQSTVTDLEEERDQLQDELTELKEGILHLSGSGKTTGRGSRLHDLLVHFQKSRSEYLTNNLIKGDIEGILEALEVLV